MGGGPDFRGRAVTVVCADLARSERFYEGVLGAKRLPGESECPWFSLGGLMLTIMPTAGQPTPATFPGHAMSLLWLEVDDLAAARRHLSRHGVPIVEVHDGMLVCADPDGLLIEVWQSAA